MLHQGNTNIHGPHQGGWVTDVAGDSWFVHFEDRYAYGRVVHLQPMSWTADGWCTMGIDTNGDGIGEPVATHRKPASNAPQRIVTPAENDEFNSPTLGLQWQWFGNPERDWAMHSPEGFLRLYTQPYTSLWESRNILCQKLTAPTETITTKVSFRGGTVGDRGGLIIAGRDFATLSFVVTEEGTLLRQTRCVGADKGGEEQTISQLAIDDTTEILLRVVVGEGGVCQFYWAKMGDSFNPIGEPFKAREGKWIGAKFGLFAVTDGRTNDGGWIDVDWVRITK